MVDNLLGRTKAEVGSLCRLLYGWRTVSGGGCRHFRRLQCDSEILGRLEQELL